MMLKVSHAINKRELYFHSFSTPSYLDPDGYEFIIVSLDNKQWHFEAANSEERDEWVSIIEQEIFKSLQGNESLKPKTQSSNDIASVIQNIRTIVPGNGFCADCDASSKFFIIHHHILIFE